MKNLILLMLLLPLFATGQVVFEATLAGSSATVMIPAADVRMVNPEGSGARILRSNNLTAYTVTQTVAEVVSRADGFLYKFTDANGIARAVGKNWIKDVVLAPNSKAQITVFGVSGGYVTTESFTDVTAAIKNTSGTKEEFAELQMLVADPDSITADTFNYRTATRIEDYASSVTNGEWTVSAANGTITYTGVDSVLVEISYNFSVTHATATSQVGVAVAEDGTVSSLSTIIQGTGTGVREIVSNKFRKWIQPDEAIDARISGTSNGAIIVYSGTFAIRRL